MSSVDRLRAAFGEYAVARQARYDELMGDWSGRRDTQACFDKHKRVVAQIDAEQSAPQWPVAGHVASCDVFILDNTVVDRHKVAIQF